MNATPLCAILCFDDELDAAQRLGQQAGLPVMLVERHRFPDGELKLRLPVNAQGLLPPRLVFYRSLHQPNEKLLELLLAARTARQLGARKLTLVAPYLAYMRQDIAFSVGEVVSQRVVGGFLAELFDALLTVDPHLHRVATLQEAVPVEQAVVLSGAEPLSDWIASQQPQALLVGPDGESAQWVAQAAARHGFDYAVCTKERYGDRDVRIALPALDAKGRVVVLLDDMASTGRTLAQAAQLLLSAGAASVSVAVTHAIFGGDALEHLKQAGVNQVWSTDCVPHASNAVDMASFLAKALRPVLVRQGLDV